MEPGVRAPSISAAYVTLGAGLSLGLCVVFVGLASVFLSSRAARFGRRFVRAVHLSGWLLILMGLAESAAVWLFGVPNAESSEVDRSVSWLLIGLVPGLRIAALGGSATPSMGRCLRCGSSLLPLLCIGCWCGILAWESFSGVDVSGSNATFGGKLAIAGLVLVADVLLWSVLVRASGGLQAALTCICGEGFGVVGEEEEDEMGISLPGRGGGLGSEPLLGSAGRNGEYFAGEDVEQEDMVVMLPRTVATLALLGSCVGVLRGLGAGVDAVLRFIPERPSIGPGVGESGGSSSSSSSAGGGSSYLYFALQAGVLGLDAILGIVLGIVLVTMAARAAPVRVSALPQHVRRAARRRRRRQRWPARYASDPGAIASSINSLSPSSSSSGWSDEDYHRAPPPPTPSAPVLIPHADRVPQTIHELDDDDTSNATSAQTHTPSTVSVHGPHSTTSPKHPKLLQP